MVVHGDDPAFPRPMAFAPAGHCLDSGVEGMSLRAWLAGQAMLGILSNPTTHRAGVGDVAEAAVLQADAQIAALNRTPTP